MNFMKQLKNTALPEVNYWEQAAAVISLYFVNITNGIK